MGESKRGRPETGSVSGAVSGAWGGGGRAGAPSRGRRWGRPLGLALGLSLAWSVGVPAEARACGFVAETREFDNADASFLAQTALVHRRAASVDMHLRMLMAPGSPELSWVIPVRPGVRLGLGDAEIFSALDAITAPQVQIRYAGSGGGCSAADSAGAGEDADVREVGTIGEYAYAIIAQGPGQTGVDSVTDWLQDQGYVLPSGTGSALQPYADAGFEFLGVKLARPRSDLDTDLTPLVITYDDDTTNLPAYPLGLSRVSAPDTLPLVLYVIGPSRARVEGAVEFTVADIADRLADRTFFAYDEAVLGLTGAAEDLVFVTEAVLLDWRASAPEVLAALAEPESVLTRLFAQVPRDDLRDVQLTYHPAGLDAVSPLQKRTLGDDGEGCRAGTEPGAHLLHFGLLGLGLLGLGRFTRRRRRAA